MKTPEQSGLLETSKERKGLSLWGQAVQYVFGGIGHAVLISVNPDFDRFEAEQSEEQLGPTLDTLDHTLDSAEDHGNPGI